jgi:kynurenine formamidase
MKIKIIDLSRKLTDGTEAYPGDQVGLEVKKVANAKIDGYNLTSFTHLEAHCGTHIDSPLHFVAEGTDIASLPLMMPPVVVVKANAGPIDKHIFSETVDLSGHAVLVQTGWDEKIGTHDYYKNSPSLTPETAHFLADSKIAMVGMDFPSPDPFASEDYSVHHILLGAGIPIVEGLVGLDQLDDLRGDQYFLAFPLKIAEVEGSPVRAAVICLER